MNKRVREIQSTFKDLGVEIENLEKSVKHYKIYVKKGCEKKMFVAAGTPSDKRSILNFRSDIKRWLRSCS